MNAQGFDYDNLALAAFIFGLIIVIISVIDLKKNNKEKNSSWDFQLILSYILGTFSIALSIMYMILEYLPFYFGSLYRILYSY